jgi:hypothetical protein
MWWLLKGCSRHADQPSWCVQRSSGLMGSCEQVGEAHLAKRRRMQKLVRAACRCTRGTVPRVGRVGAHGAAEHQMESLVL